MSAARGPHNAVKLYGAGGGEIVDALGDNGGAADAAVGVGSDAPAVHIPLHERPRENERGDGDDDEPEDLEPHRRAERRADERHERAENEPDGYKSRGHGFNDEKHDERRDPECDRSGRWDHGKNLPYFNLYLSYRIFRRSAITFSPKITL